jgi:trk system potassium uptake protein TrkH
LNVQLDLKILGWLLVGVGAVQIAPLVAALASREPALPFVASALAAIVFGLSIGLAAKPAEPSMRLRDGFLVVAFSWILASTLGALPYLLTGTLEPVDALFESIAGFTTTGSTVMRDIEAAPRGLLLWRSLTQWLGGMGIIVFAIAIVPMLGIGGMQLFKAEMPGVGLDKLRPRIVETARRLLFIYLAFTGIAFLVYALLGMSLFEALCHALTTFSTGGFSTRNASFAAFASPALEWAAIFFMLLAGINFTLHYRLLSGQVRTVAAHSELRYFLGLVFGASLLVAWFVAGSDWPDLTTLRSALFQVVSITTTTGYGSADYETWPVVTSLILLALMTMGGMAGSTAGGVKGLRVLLLARGLRNSLARMLHPHLVRPVKFAGEPIPVDVLTGIGSFVTAYFAVALLAAAIVAAAGYDLETAISAALTSLSNVGPGFGAVGPTDHFAHLPSSVKLTLSACMIAGRLELFTVLVLFQRSFWRG